MNIKDISGLGSTRPVDGSTRNTDPAPKSDSGQSGKDSGETTAKADRLSLTSIGRYLASAAEASAPVDRQRVDAIRDALANGSYEIDSERVAAKLMKMEDDLV